MAFGDGSEKIQHAAQQEKTFLSSLPGTEGKHHETEKMQFGDMPPSYFVFADSASTTPSMKLLRPEEEDGPWVLVLKKGIKVVVVYDEDYFPPQQVIGLKEE